MVMTLCGGSLAAALSHFTLTIIFTCFFLPLVTLAVCWIMPFFPPSSICGATESSWLSVAEMECIAKLESRLWRGQWDVEEWQWCIIYPRLERAEAMCLQRLHFNGQVCRRVGLPTDHFDCVVVYDALQAIPSHMSGPSDAISISILAED